MVQSRTSAGDNVSAIAAASRAVTFASLDIVLDAAGIAYLPRHETLIVSDLHLEKGSAAIGRYVPRLDSHDTLLRLDRLIAAYIPRRVICLGDSFQDVRAGGRMAHADRGVLNALCAKVAEWVWVSGNHDPHMPPFCAGVQCSEFALGGVVFRHQPLRCNAEAQIAGHFHPRASVWTGKYRFSGPCFYISGHIFIMPAFGAYTSGLDCTYPAIQDLHVGPAKVFMLHSGKIWPLAAR